MKDVESTERKEKNITTQINIISIIVIIITLFSVFGYMALGVWVPIPFRFGVIPCIVLLGVLSEIIVISKNVVLKKRLMILVLLESIFLIFLIVKKPSGVNPDKILCKYFPISEKNYEKIYENQLNDISLNVYLDKNVNQVYYCIYKTNGKKIVLERCYRSLPAWVLKNYDKEISKIEKVLSKENYISDEVVLVSLYEITQTEKYTSSQITLCKSVFVNNKDVYIYKFSK